ncbi:Exo70 exocyst complex subunit [Musa troglodytarum]|uniref:Exocyst subunit Exo70 family protein n=1 Tax=Musa troglodytarum TaxID=320322 RepID=A0A9E7I4P1_9LILI|nr:Exo70 exocyst complex subunit [Musa troglodytarum]URE45465.1 Exo70 exocyst complex subunit [Musa troglodytarum]
MNINDLLKILDAGEVANPAQVAPRNTSHPFGPVLLGSTPHWTFRRFHGGMLRTRHVGFHCPVTRPYILDSLLNLLRRATTSLDVAPLRPSDPWCALGPVCRHRTGIFYIIATAASHPTRLLLQTPLQRSEDREALSVSMDGSGGAAAVEGDLEAAEKLIMQWDSTASSAGDERMLFDGGDRSDAERFLRAVDEIRRSISEPIATGSPRRSSSSASHSSSENAIQIAMARLEDEFRNLLLTRPNEIEVDELVDLSTLSMKSSAAGEGSGDLSDAEEGGGVDGGRSMPSCLRRWRKQQQQNQAEQHAIDLLPSDAVDDLRSIAERMIAAGYGRECVQVYAGARKAAVDMCLRQLGVEKHSIGEVQRLEWDALEAKIRRWIRAAKICRRLCDRVFDGLGITDDAPFAETVKGAAIQLFGFAEAISIGRRSPEKLFKILDLHDTISDLLPDIAAVFLSKSAESIYTQAAEILSRLAEAVRGILSEFENAVLRDPPKTPVPGGTIHPLTRYVMNYISLISDYKPTLIELIITRPSASSRFSGDDQAAVGATPPEIEFPEAENQTPLAAHLIWIIVVLEHNLENKANLYKDTALAHLFLMNNVHYIVHKVKGSPELREMIGDDYLRKLTGKFRLSATSYQRATWGIHVSGSFSSGVSKSMLRERFRAFNAAFEEAHKTQAIWFKLLPAYRSFLGRFRQHRVERHPEMYIKYSVEDLEMALSDFFEGTQFGDISEANRDGKTDKFITT